MFSAIFGQQLLNRHPQIGGVFGWVLKETFVKKGSKPPTSMILVHICLDLSLILNLNCVIQNGPSKWAFSCKRGRFRAKSHEIKVIGNTILKTFYFMTFFPRMHTLAINDS